MTEKGWGRQRERRGVLNRVFHIHQHQNLIVLMNGWVSYTLKSPTGFQMLYMSLSPLYKCHIVIMTVIDFKREFSFYN